jgi:hypothetical protein
MVSNASVERVFSLLNHSFDDHQQSAMQDYEEVTVQLRKIHFGYKVISFGCKVMYFGCKVMYFGSTLLALSRPK